MADKLPQQMDIPGTNGRYFVKVDGTVWRRWKHRSPTVLKGRYRPGDRNVEYKLSCDGSYRVVVASSIMKQTYFAHLPKGVSLRHRNGLATDFAVWNLQPMSKQRLGRECNRSLDARCVERVDPGTGEVVEIYRSAREAGRENYCSYQAVLDACNGKNKRRKGIGPDGFRYRWA